MTVRGNVPALGGASLAVKIAAFAWLLVASACGLQSTQSIQTASSPTGAEPAPSASVFVSEYAPPPPRLFPRADGANEPSDAERQLSPSGDAELFNLTFEIEARPVVAIVRGGNFSKPVLFEGFLRGIFLGEHDLILEKEGALVFASDDGKLGPSFDASWPPRVQEGDRVALQRANELLFLDLRGKLLARVNLPGLALIHRFQFIPGGGAIFDYSIEEEILRGEYEKSHLVLVAPDGRELWRRASSNSWELSRNRRVFAVSEGGDKTLSFSAYSTRSGALLGQTSTRVHAPTRPRFALTPEGERLIVRDGANLRVLDMKNNRSRVLPGYPRSNDLVLGEIFSTSKGEVCLWSTDSMERSSSCEAAYIVNLDTGARRRLGKEEVCVKKNGLAVNAKLPPLAPGRGPVHGPTPSLNTVCGLDVSDNFELVARLEGAKGDEPTDVNVVVRQVTSGKLVATIPLPGSSSWSPFAGLKFSAEGSRLVAWGPDRFWLIDVPNQKALLEGDRTYEPIFLREKTRILHLFSEQSISDWDGNPSKGWPSEGVRTTAIPTP